MSFDGRFRLRKKFHKIGPPIASKSPGTGGPLILMVDCGQFAGFRSGGNSGIIVSLLLRIVLSHLMIIMIWGD
jgi:hypothetical protein